MVVDGLEDAAEEEGGGVVEDDGDEGEGEVETVGVEVGGLRDGRKRRKEWGREGCMYALFRFDGRGGSMYERRCARSIVTIAPGNPFVLNVLTSVLWYKSHSLRALSNRSFSVYCSVHQLLCRDYWSPRSLTLLVDSFIVRDDDFGNIFHLWRYVCISFISKGRVWAGRSVYVDY